MELKRQNHEFPPVYDENSEILILGSFPSVKSREMQFFYGHPQNRFWKVMAQVLHENVPQTIPEKKRDVAAASYCVVGRDRKLRYRGIQ